jgi:putative peptidoglycan lipid II flippase
LGQAHLWVLSGLLVLVLLLAGVGVLVLPLLGTGFSKEKVDLTLSLFFYLLPLVFLQGVCVFWVAVLNAAERFIAPALAQGLPALVTLALLIGFHDLLGIYALVGGALVGTLALLAVVVSQAARQRLIGRPAPRPETREVVAQFWPVAAGAALMSGTTFVDQAMAAWLPAGSLAALTYGDRLVGVLVGLGGIALGTATLPQFAKLVAGGHWLELDRTLRFWRKLIRAVAIPAVALLVVFSQDLVRVLWERGAFTEADTRVVGQIQIAYALRVPIYLESILMVRLLSSMGQNRWLLPIAGVNLVLNFVLNLILMQFLGAVGIALSTTLVYATSYAMIGYALRRVWLHQSSLSEQGR